MSRRNEEHHEDTPYLETATPEKLLEDVVEITNDYAKALSEIASEISNTIRRWRHDEFVETDPIAHQFHRTLSSVLEGIMDLPDHLYAFVELAEYEDSINVPLKIKMLVYCVKGMSWSVVKQFNTVLWDNVLCRHEYKRKETPVQILWHLAAEINNLLQSSHSDATRKVSVYG